MRRCPYCAEEIQVEAVFCRYCGKDTRVPVPPPISPEPDHGQVRTGLLSTTPAVPPPAVPRTTKKEIPRPISGFFYLVIGMAVVIGFGLVALFVSALLFPAGYWSGGMSRTDATGYDTLAGFVTLGFLLFYCVLAAEGRHGNQSLPSILKMLLWSVVPILSWAVPYYFGKGLYMIATGQRYQQIPI